MALGLIDKLTNFLLPPNEEGIEPAKAEQPVNEAPVQELKQRPRLRVHSQQTAQLRIVVDLPTGFDDVQAYADYLKSNVALVTNYQQVDFDTQQRMDDFLSGVCYTLEGTVQRISEQVVLYTYANIEIDKQIFGYSVPTYVRLQQDGI